MDDLAAARAGDEAAFERLVAPHRRGLEAHCYRMVGSVHDAEDVVQDSLVRAWRAVGRLDGPVRPWLVTIATNRCLTLLSRRSRRELPADLGPGAEQVSWLEPYPDRRLEPEGAYEVRERIELAFVAALQRLPARQRAVLLLCEVLAYPARDVAGMLDSTVASVTSALQRARRTLGAGAPAQPPPDDPAVRRLAAAYAAAWEAGDVDAIVAMLTADVRYAMPPLREWYAGRDAVRAFLAGPLALRWRFVPARANGQLAFGTYRWDGSVWAWGGLDVLTLRGGEVAEVVSFLDDEIAPVFALPMSLPAGGGR